MRTQEVARALSTRRPAAHRRRQARRGAREAVLHVDRRKRDVGARLEVTRDLDLAVGLARRLVDQAGRAVHLLLDHALTLSSSVCADAPG